LPFVAAYLDNPAGRLFRLLTLIGKTVNTPIHRAWSSALGLPEGSTSDLFRGLSYVYELPDQIDLEIGRIEDPEAVPELALRWRGGVRSSLSEMIFSDKTTSHITPHLDTATMVSLETCSYFLHLYRPQVMPGEADLARIAELVGQLEAEVTVSSFTDSELQEFLLSHVRAMTRALNEVAVRGAVALEEALDKAVGAACRRVDLAVRSQENPSAWRKFGEVIVAIAAVLQITTTALALPADVRAAIEGPPSPERAVEVIVVSPQAEVPPSTAAGDTKQH